MLIVLIVMFAFIVGFFFASMYFLNGYDFLEDSKIFSFIPKKKDNKKDVDMIETSEEKIIPIKSGHLEPDPDSYRVYKPNTFVNINVCPCGQIGTETELSSFDPCPKCGSNIQRNIDNHIFGDRYIARWEIFEGEWQWLRPISNLSLTGDALAKEIRRRKFNNLIK